MNYKEEIEKIGIKKSHIAKLMNISNTLLSFYINDNYPIPPEREKQLKSIINRFKQVKT